MGVIHKNLDHKIDIFHMYYKSLENLLPAGDKNVIQKWGKISGL